MSTDLITSAATPTAHFAFLLPPGAGVAAIDSGVTAIGGARQVYGAWRTAPHARQQYRPALDRTGAGQHDTEQRTAGSAIISHGSGARRRRNNAPAGRYSVTQQRTIALATRTQAHNHDRQRAQQRQQRTDRDRRHGNTIGTAPMPIQPAQQPGHIWSGNDIDNNAIANRHNHNNHSAQQTANHWRNRYLISHASNSQPRQSGAPFDRQARRKRRNNNRCHNYRPAQRTAQYAYNQSIANNNATRSAGHSANQAPASTIQRALIQRRHHSTTPGRTGTAHTTIRWQARTIIQRAQIGNTAQARLIRALIIETHWLAHHYTQQSRFTAGRQYNNQSGRQRQASARTAQHLTPASTTTRHAPDHSRSGIIDQSRHRLSGRPQQQATHNTRTHATIMHNNRRTQRPACAGAHSARYDTAAHAIIQAG